jgi:cullin 3
MLSFEELYRNAYNLVLYKHGDILYDGVKASVQSHLNAKATLVTATPNSRLLEAVSLCWSEHKVTMIMVRDILMYMDRTYVQRKKKKPVYELGLQIFREIIWENEAVKPRLTSILLENVEKERNGQVSYFDHSLFRFSVSS